MRALWFLVLAVLTPSMILVAWSIWRTDFFDQDPKSDTKRAD